MCTKVFIITLSAIILAIVGLVSCSIIETSLDSVQHPALSKLVKMRCTRRFSPGECVDNVVPVWTFVFLQQNCTERLGCPKNYRTNLFPSYRMCIKRCRPLVDMYLKMVEFEESHAESNDTVESECEMNDTDDRNLREGFKKYDSIKFPKKVIPVNLEYLSLDDEDEEVYKEGEQDSRFIVYKDSNVNEDIMVPDVDYVSGEIRDEVDLMQIY